MMLSPKQEELNHQNWTYTAMQSRAGRGEMDAVNLVLANNEVELPQTGSKFCAYLEGIHVVDVMVLGMHNQMVQNYQHDIINRMSALTQRIESLYDTEEGHCYAYLLVLDAEQVCSHCMTPIPHEHMAALLRSQAVGTLSWQTLWTTVVQTILGDPAQMVVYQHFVDFVHVASTQRPALAGAVNARAPEVERGVNVPITMPIMREQA
jgi:hypothetical protein